MANGGNVRVNLWAEQQGGGTRAQYKGVVAALEKALTGMTPEKMGEEYAKQKRSGEAGKNEYKEEALAYQQKFQAYAYMQDKTADIKILYGLGKYYNGDVAVELKGKVLGRMGDRTEMGEPLVVRLPEQTAWSWKVCVANSDAVQWGGFAEGGGDNKWKLWQPATTNVVNIHLPRMIGLPPDLAKYLCEKKRTALEAYFYVCSMINNANSGVSAEQAELLKHWFLVAGQCAPGSDSSQLAIEISPVLNTDGDFQRWAYEQANSILGPKEQQQVVRVQQAQSPGEGELKVALQQMTTVLGGIHKEQTVAIQEHKEAKKKEESGVLDEYDIAKLMGWSGVDNPENCEPIWQELLTCKGEGNKRNVIMKAMKKFAKAHSMKIDSNCFLSKEVLEDIIKQKPNETGVMATTEASGRGVSNLVVLGRTQVEIEAMLRQEEAWNRSDGNRTLKEAEKQTKVAPRKPPTGYFTLVLNVATFACLLRVLYGPNCDLFKKVWVIYQTLDMDEVFGCRDAFTSIKCKEVTWAIYEECRNFFRKLTAPEDFTSGGPIDFPEAGLQDVYPKVRRQENIYRSTFPVTWMELGGNTSTGQQGGSAEQATQQTQLRGQGNGGRGAGGAGGYSRTAWYDVGRFGGRGGGRGGGAGGGRGGGAGGAAGRVAEGQDLGHVHSKIRAAFPEFFTRYGGKVSIRNIMEAGGISWQDMPKLPSATMNNGMDVLCWAKVMGVCKFGPSCKFAASHGEQVPDDFAAEVVRVLQPGVEAMMKDTYRFPSQKRQWYQEGGAGGGGPIKRERFA